MYYYLNMDNNENLELNKKIFNCLSNPDINKIILDYLDYKDVIHFILTNKDILKYYIWSNQINNSYNCINLDYTSELYIFDYISGVRKKECNQYMNKCKIKYLFKKYLHQKNEPNEYDINILNEILLATIPNNNKEDRTHDVDCLKNFGSNITSIPRYYFSKKELTNITIPNIIKSIQSYAFYNNNLYEVIIPNNVIMIGNNSFENNEITKVIIGYKVNIIGESAFRKNRISNIIILDNVNVCYYAFADNLLEEVIINNNVITIGESAFYKNLLTHIKIPTRFKNNITNYFDNIGKITFEYT